MYVFTYQKEREKLNFLIFCLQILMLYRIAQQYVYLLNYIRLIFNYLFKELTKIQKNKTMFSEWDSSLRSELSFPLNTAAH